MFTALQALLNSLAVTFDLPILDWIQAHLQCTFLDVTMPIVTLFGDGGVFWIAVAVVLLLFAKYRKTGFSMGMALVLGLQFPAPGIRAGDHPACQGPERLFLPLGPHHRLL